MEDKSPKSIFSLNIFEETDDEKNTTSFNSIFNEFKNNGTIFETNTDESSSIFKESIFEDEDDTCEEKSIFEDELEDDDDFLDIDDEDDEYDEIIFDFDDEDEEEDEEYDEEYFGSPFAEIQTPSKPRPIPPTIFKSEKNIVFTKEKIFEEENDTLSSNPLFKNTIFKEEKPFSEENKTNIFNEEVEKEDCKKSLNELMGLLMRHLLG